LNLSLNAAIASGARFIPHSEVIAGVVPLVKKIQKVREAGEVLFVGEIPWSAVRLIR
jgi:hypothetical protein